MPLILSIDTALENAGIALAEGETIVGTRTNSRQMDHAGWIHVAIKELLQEAGKNINEINAVAVTAGPGSYTGLRVGMATAKGLCYSINIPLITETTLKLIAATARKRTEIGYSLPVVFCPMIDARRMEVFTAVYDEKLDERMEPAALILDENSFSGLLDNSTVVFCGNGAVKWQAICSHKNALFSDVSYSVADLTKIAAKKFIKSDFTELAYAEPFYLKNVYTGSK